MKIMLKQFGTILTSRPAGRDAYTETKSNILPLRAEQIIEIDFSGVKVLSPGWADEFLTPIKNEFGKNFILLPIDNSSVKASLEILEQQHK